MFIYRLCNKRFYLPEKVKFPQGARLRLISLFRVDKSLCLPKLKSITVLLYNFGTPRGSEEIAIYFQGAEEHWLLF